MPTLIADVFHKDPRQHILPNQGVAKVGDVDEGILRYELETFVCDGEYARGLERILDAFLKHVGYHEQPGVWVSGFFGSGKSHLVKVLRCLWVDHQFRDGSRARGIVTVPRGIRDYLVELDTAGRRHGGLHAISGVIDQSEQPTMRRALLSLVFKSKGLPGNWQQARFCRWLQRAGRLEEVRQRVEGAGANWELELANLFVSPVIARALLDIDANLGRSETNIRELLKTQFQTKDDPTNDEIVETIRDVLGDAQGRIPCTLLVIDEVQQTIGEDDTTRSYDFQTLAEKLCSSFQGRLLLVATGQNALTGVPSLQRLQGRFPVQVNLSDADVKSVIRQTILRKRPDRTAEIEAVLTHCSGEIDRHLRGTRLEPRPEDRQHLVADYPVLPTRRRFWDAALRALDRGGNSGQLRNQLRIIHEAVRAIADRPLGEVIPAQAIFAQIATQLVQAGILLPEIDRLIRSQNDGTPDGHLRADLCALIYIIGRIPRDDQAQDLGLRATAETLADLMVTDLTAGSASLRERIGEQLQRLVDLAVLLRIGDEYRLQTEEGKAWEGDFQECLRRLSNDPAHLAALRTERLRGAVAEVLSPLRLRQGQSRIPRRLGLRYGEAVPPAEADIVLWVRDGWEVTERQVLEEALAAGQDSADIFAFLPKQSPNEVLRHLAAYHAAKEVLDRRPVPSTAAGVEARQAMETRKQAAERELQQLVQGIVEGAVIVLGGGTPVEGRRLAERIVTAAQHALARRYPEFDRADHPRWDQVREHARRGDPSALQAVGHDGDIDQHPVTKAVLAALGSGTKGNELRRKLADPPYGWGQDAVDAALVLLVQGGFVSATRDGVEKSARELDANAIGPCTFRAKRHIITRAQRIAVRELLTSFSIDCQRIGEAEGCRELLRRLKAVAEAAGGDPPLPPKPDATWLHELEALSDDELLNAVHAAAERLKQADEDWRAAGDRISARRPAWDLLCRLLEHARDLPGIGDLESQRQAILEQRRLLAEPDPLPPLLQQLADRLRQALAERAQAHRRALELAETELAADPAWHALAAEDQQRLRQDCQLLPLPEPERSTPEQLLAALDQRSLAQWATETDAVPGRARRAREHAIATVQPKARAARLPRATITTPAELQAWLEQARAELERQLREGPLVVP